MRREGYVVVVTTHKNEFPRATRPLAVGVINNELILLYEKTYNKQTQLQLAKCNETGHFTESDRYINIITKRGRHYDLSGLSSVYFTQIGHQQVFAFTHRSHLVFANSNWNKSWHSNILDVTIPTKSIKGPGVFVSDYMFEGSYVLFSGATDIKLSFTNDISHWRGVSHTVLRPREDQFDCGRLSPILSKKIKQGVLLLYYNLLDSKYHRQVSVGAALFAADDPGRMLWQSEVPLWEHKTSKKDGFKFIGGQIGNDDIQLFWTMANKRLYSLHLPNPFANDTSSYPATRLRRHPSNPIISPRDNGWESVGVFNPAVLQDRDGKIHIMYRALDVAGISYLGYANSSDGFTIDFRSEAPAYWPRENWEAGGVTGHGWSDAFGSGGGWGGCEDPKLTEIDDVVYLTYVAHNGSGPPRIALSKISLEDFIAHNWQCWSQPKLISEPGVVNKSGVILPEKIAGKHVIFHRVFPNILIDTRDDLEFEESDRWLKSESEIPIRPHSWDSRKLSIGATPIRIRDGWLVIYHAVDDRDSSRYKIGAMILDADDPSKVLYRTNKPILTPDATYENDWKFGVAYPSGAAIKDGTLLVYYGGGDKFVCVATANLEQFIEDLKKQRGFSLHTKNIKLVNK